MIRTAAPSGLDSDWLGSVAAALTSLLGDDRYMHVWQAVARLLRGDAEVLIDDGTGTLPLPQVLRNLEVARDDPERAARALAVAAVASGGSADGARPAWQHCQDYGNQTRGGHTPSHPIPGVHSPGGARSLYNLAIGSQGDPGSTATAARGAAS